MKIIIIVFCLFYSLEMYSQKQMMLKVEVVDSRSIDTVYLVKGMQPFNAGNVVDSFVLNNNKGTLSFDIDETNFYILRTSLKHGVNLLSFIGSPGNTVWVKWILSDLGSSQAIFRGSRLNTLMQKEIIIPGNEAVKKMNTYIIDSVYKIPDKTDTVKIAYYRNQNRFWADSLKNIYLTHIRKHPKEFTALFFLNQYYRNFTDEFVGDFLKNLPKKLQRNSLAKELAINKFQIEKIKSFAEFKLNDTLGNRFDYSAYSTKIVLVDFWASWCKPCLENIPKLEKILTHFEGSHFKILGVSIDQNREAWLTALKREKLQWENVHESLGVKGFSSIFLKISTIPRYVLLGKDGIVLNKDLNLSDAIEEIEKALKTLQ